ncbi:MAG: DUF1330 domain-containing protein [Pseudomonadota bacterium]
MQTLWPFAMIAMIGVAVLLIWRIGATQPSQVLLGQDSIIFLALKSGDRENSPALDRLTDATLWRARSQYPFIGKDDIYWTDYLLLSSDTGITELRDVSRNFEDAYAARVQPLKVPAMALGILRTQHLLGITKRPDGPLPESEDEIEGRPDVMPTRLAFDASKAMRPEAQISMVNYLGYFADETGDKTAARGRYQRYGREAMRAVHRVGGQFLFAGRISEVLIESYSEPAPAEWDDLAVMIYPDPMAIFYMDQHPDYKAALDDRDKSLERTVVVATHAY